MDLSGKNYLPSLRQCYTDYEQLRWLLGRRFAGKAKVTYEFETFFNQVELPLPGHGPAVPRLGLANGHDVAVHPSAAGPVLRRLALSESRQLAAKGPQLPHCLAGVRRSWPAMPTTIRRPKRKWFSATRRFRTRAISAFSAATRRSSTRARSMPHRCRSARTCREIAGCGRSPLVSYEGSGAYFLRVEEDKIELLILPDVTYPRPLWQRPGRPPWTPTCELDSQTPHNFCVHLPGWEGTLKVESLADGAVPSRETHNGSIDLVPGRYRMSRRRETVLPTGIGAPSCDTLLSPPPPARYCWRGRTSLRTTTSRFPSVGRWTGSWAR